MSAPAAKSPSGHRADDMRAVSALHNMCMTAILAGARHDPETVLRRARALSELIRSTVESCFCDSDPHADAIAAVDRELAAFMARRAAERKGRERGGDA